MKNLDIRTVKPNSKDKAKYSIRAGIINTSPQRSSPKIIKIKKLES